MTDAKRPTPKLRDLWSSLAMTQGADTDQAPEPDRRDAAGDVPPDLTDPGPGPFAEQHEPPPPPPPGPFAVTIAAPVEIVAALSWQIATVTVALVPVQIANADPSRLTISVTNRGAEAIYVAARAEEVIADPTRGSIAVDETRTWGHTAAIWAQCDINSAVVEITSERR